jgi:rhodanese-related sulfurtransferase
MAFRKGVHELVDEATREIRTISPEEALSLPGQDEVVLVDLRDIRERVREGFIGGSLHAPRGMLEFWVDPDSPYYRDSFGSGRHFVFYCQSGWRSALATKTVQDMGLSRVSHIESGFKGWVETGGDVIKTKDGREPKS